MYVDKKYINCIVCFFLTKFEHFVDVVKILFDFNMSTDFVLVNEITLFNKTVMDITLKILRIITYRQM